jgi:iron complex outermembrane receptor protein
LFSGASSFDFLGVDPVEVNGETITSTDYIRRRWLDNDFYAVNANVNYNDNALDVSAGAFYSYYDGDHFGEILWSEFPTGYNYEDRYYEGNGKKREISMCEKATYRFNKQWSAFADLQGRFLRHETTGLTSDRELLEVDVTYDFFNPKAGLSFQLNDRNQLYASYGRANREPRRSDFEQGLFIAETLDDIELGWRFSSAKTKVNTNIYYMDYKDQLVLTGAIDDVGAPIRATSGSSYRLGIEIEA